MDRARPNLRPLTIGETIDVSIRMYRANWRTLLKISAAVMGPIGLIQLVATVFVGPVSMESFIETSVTEPTSVSEALGPLIPIYSVLFSTAILALLGTVLVNGASITAIAEIYQGNAPDWRESLRVGLKRWLPLFGVTFLATLVPSIGLIFCIVPGVWLYIVWSMSSPPVITEDLGTFAALSRSKQLVSGRFWPVFGAVALGYLLYTVAQQIISLLATVATVASVFVSNEMSFVPTVIAQVVVQIVATPFLAIITAVIYFDLRVRKEGYDLEMMAAELSSHEIAPTDDPGATDDPFGLGLPPGE